jgi:hypothetical protein
MNLGLKYQWYDVRQIWNRLKFTLRMVSIMHEKNGDGNMTKNSTFKKIISIIVIVNLMVFLTGCGGTKVIKEPKPLEITKPLAEGSDQNISATLIWVIVRDGPGTWAKNADWDEYLLKVINETENNIQIINVDIVDSLGVKLATSSDYKELVNETYHTTKRYRESNQKVKAGIGIGTVMAVMAVGGATFAGAAATATAVAPAAALSGGAGLGGAALAGGLFVLVPTVVVIGLVRYSNRKKVTQEIQKRHTALPATISSHKELTLNIFFPLAPSPTQLEITYMIAGVKENLVVNTSEALNGLHLVHEE